VEFQKAADLVSHRQSREKKNHQSNQERKKEKGKATFPEAHDG